jgi:large subunit ribosomal protein L32
MCRIEICQRSVRGGSCDCDKFPNIPRMSGRAERKQRIPATPYSCQVRSQGSDPHLLLAARPKSAPIMQLVKVARHRYETSHTVYRSAHTSPHASAARQCLFVRIMAALTTSLLRTGGLFSFSTHSLPRFTSLRIASVNIALPTAAISIPSLLSDIWEGILKAVPKKKTSHMKRRHRLLAGKALKDVKSVVKCPGCGKPKKSHTLCPYCVSGKRRSSKVYHSA